MVNRNKIEIDFKTGVITVKLLNTEVCINTSVDQEKNRFVIDNVYLGELEVSLFAAMVDNRLSIDISPPDGSTLEDDERLMPLIADEINKLSPRRFLPSKYVQYRWGVIRAYTEWRDGGYGIHFSYRPTKRRT